MPRIHPTAIVEGEVELAEDSEVGAYCVLRGAVRLGRGVVLLNHVTLQGPCEIGEGATLYPGAAVGFPAQDLKYGVDSPTAGVRIGAGTVLREHATVHASTGLERPTVVGEGVYMMATSHVGHDAVVGDGAILINSALVAGHARVGERAIMSGNTALHQFNRMGRLSFLSGGVVLSVDLPPYCMCRIRNRIAGLNVVGMRRAGVPREHISALRVAFRELVRPSASKDALVAGLRERGVDCPPMLEIAEFYETATRTVAGPETQPPSGFASWMHAWERGELVEEEEAL